DGLREPHGGRRLRAQASARRTLVAALGSAGMPLYLIERTFAEQLELSSDDVRLIEAANEESGVDWLFSFLSADRRRTYCLYEAPSPDQIITAAKRANVPVDKIVEVSKFQPELVRQT